MGKDHNKMLEKVVQIYGQANLSLIKIDVYLGV